MLLLLTIIVVALVFDYTNGFHDTANAIATSVSTRALSPRVAVIMAAGLNLIGALLYTGVAKTVGEGLVDTDLVTLELVLAALLGAVTWNFITWSLVPAIQSIADTINGALIGALGAVLGPIASMVGALTGITTEANNATDAVNALIAAIHSIPAMPGRAAGGPVRAGKPYTVGERGPETFVPATSGMIIPNGGRTVNIYVTGNTFGNRQDVDYMLKQLDRKLRLQGGILPV